MVWLQKGVTQEKPLRSLKLEDYLFRVTMGYLPSPSLKVIITTVTKEERR